MALSKSRGTSSRRWRAGRAILLVLAAGLAVAVGWWVLVGPAAPPAAPFANPPTPQGLADLALGGSAGPFFPSAAATGNGRVLDRAPSSAQTCGASGCHAEIVSQWQGSAHRFSGLENPWYRASYQHAREQIGDPAARWCAGCHSPGLLLSGRAAEEPLPTADPGVDCLVCHAMSHAESSLGQGDYELSIPALETLATSTNGILRALYRGSVRLNPQAHARTYRGSSTLGQAPAEACSTCHRGQLDEAVGGDRWRELFDDYSSWAKGPYSGRSAAHVLHPARQSGCVDCHMPRSSPEAFRIHDFAAANAALAVWRGDERQLARVTEVLQNLGARLDIFAMTEGDELGVPAKPLPVNQEETILAPLDRIPATIRRGESRRIDLVVRMSETGHLFPGGKSGFGETWLEVRGTDESGKVIFWNGRTEPGSPVDPAARAFGALWIDAESHPVNGHELWKARARVNDLRLRPDEPQRVRFRVDVPTDARDRLTLTAALRYRPLSPAFNAWAFAQIGSPPPELPILTLAETSHTFALVAPDAELPDMTKPEHQPRIDAERWYDYGLALWDQDDHAGCRMAYRRAIDLVPEKARAYAELALVIPGLDEPRALLEKALELEPELGRARFWAGLLQRAEGRNEESLATHRALAEEYPRDPDVRREIGNTLFTLERFAEAAEEYRAVLEIDPYDVEAHLNLSRAYRALSEDALAERHAALHTRLILDDTSRARVESYLAANPTARRGRQSNPDYVSSYRIDGGGEP